MKNYDPRPVIQRWLTTQKSMHRQLEALRKEIEQLRRRNAELIKAKASAENQAESLRREKETLRAKVASQKKTAESAQRVTDQLSAKNTELRDEMERMRNAERARSQKRR